MKILPEISNLTAKFINVSEGNFTLLTINENINILFTNGNQLNKVHFKLCPSCLEIKQEDDGYALEHFVAN